jgi:DNA-binding MarR family transcriptional regulator
MTEDEIREKVGLQVVEKEEDTAVDSKTKDAQAALKGSVGGVSGIITLLQNVKQGLITENSAIAVLVELYGFTEEIAKTTVTGDVIPENVAAELRSVFSREEEDQKLIEYFENCGSSDYEKVDDGKPLNFVSETSARLHNDINRKYWFSTIDPFDTAILSILKENPNIPFIAIAEQLQLSIERVMAGLQALNEANAINIQIDEILDSTQRVVEVTPEGDKLIDEIPPVEEEFAIRFTYEKRKEAKGASIIKGTREFCRRLVQMVEEENKSWDMEEIVQLGVKADRNVWMRGGGFWRRENGETSYHCRHYWKQHLMRIKK